MSTPDLKYNPSTNHVYRDGAVFGTVKIDKDGTHRYQEYRFADPLVLVEKTLAAVLRKVRQHEDGKGPSP